MDADTKRIAANFAKLRKKKKISLQELAPEIGVTYQQLQKYEHGLNRIPSNRLVKIAACLDVEVIDFFAGKQSAQPDPRQYTEQTQRDHQLLELFHALPEEQQLAVVQYIQKLN